MGKIFDVTKNLLGLFFRDLLGNIEIILFIQNRKQVAEKGAFTAAVVSLNPDLIALFNSQSWNFKCQAVDGLGCFFNDRWESSAANLLPKKYSLFVLFFNGNILF